MFYIATSVVESSRRTTVLPGCHEVCLDDGDLGGGDDVEFMGTCSSLICSVKHDKVYNLNK